MELYWEDSLVKIFCGDILDGIEISSPVDMIFADPPWAVSREVTIHRSMNPGKYKGKDISLDFGEWDHFEDEEAYWEFTRGWLEVTLKYLRPSGHFICFFDQNRVTPLIALLKGHRLAQRQFLYWLKLNPVPRARKVDFMIALEQAIWATKEPRSGATFSYTLGEHPNYVVAPIPGHSLGPDGPRSHPTQKPVKVLEKWIAYLTKPGDTVLDPMMGSGATLVAAKRLGRRSIGVDISATYCDQAKRRIMAVTLPMNFDEEKAYGDKRIITEGL